MYSKKSWLEKIFCVWLHAHWVHRIWEFNGEHAYCRICKGLVDKVNGKWVSWDRNPNNPAAQGRS